MNIKKTDPVEATLELIGGKWKPLIIWRLMDKTMRFNELKKSLPNVTQKMLTEQLREMESHGLIHRKVYAQVPPKVEYSLTELGESLVPFLEFMCQWGTNYLKYVKNKAES
ncbi:MAG TPA: helix-turn-helix domain-containing protein [Ureibacillus sp.]|uniref:winged helix-turn-helix transcriptional regulator n=1 Tax=Peribacillus asahii TaxID=228899 RepID=UPI00207965A4|nr:helix-turn-helix domain-containing protein [Peribacillus asahii]USK61804.1 helix-turn-helix transcriptional regulator [Peribacillus asahii]HWL23492.1 helix-turn-helix domain-containing protein [Ureibacillus sp.]